MRKFHKKTGPRRSFLKGLANNLIMWEKIKTTEARAKEIRPLVERLVSVARGHQLADYRRLLSKLPKQSADKLYYEIAPRYKERAGGYLRIIKDSKSRKRDGASQATIEFVK